MLYKTVYRKVYPKALPMTILKNKSIRFTTDLDQKLEKLSHKLGRNKLMVFGQMVEYFYRTGKDPLDINDELLRKAIVKNHDAYISFTRVQEKDLLIPMKNSMDSVFEGQQNIVKFLREKQVPEIQQLKQLQLNQADKFSETDKLIHNIYQLLDDKYKLKNKFSLILENYIKGREEISGAFRSKSKEELVERCRQMVKEL